MPGDPGAFEQAGIQIVPVETDFTEIEAPLVFTQVQADRILADVRPVFGAYGSALDQIAPLPADVPPVSYLIAAWVSAGETPGAETARGWMGEQPWERAPEVQFPDAVLALFVADMAAFVGESVVPDDGSIQIDASPFLPPGPFDVQPNGRSVPQFGESRVILDGPCSTVQNFINGAFAALVNALHIQPVAGGGLLGDIANGFATIFNVAVGFAVGLLQGVVTKLTQPIFDVIRVAIATIGIATQFASLFRDTKLMVTLEPGQSSRDYRFAVGAEGDITGQFVARGESLTGKWPDALVDCAAATNVALPTVLGAGDPANWEVSQSKPVVFAATTATQVRADFTARLDFATGHESDEDAKGEATNSAAFAKVNIPRNDVEMLLKLGRDQIDVAKRALVAQVPPPLDTLALVALSAIVDPIIARVESEIAGAAAGLFTLSGQQLVFVTFHKPPDTTTSSAPPDTDPPDDQFCALFQDLVNFANQDFSDVTTWATEIVRRLNEMRPIAPAELLGDVDTMLRVYTAVAAAADILVLIQTVEPFPQATAEIGAFCGISGPSG